MRANGLWILIRTVETVESWKENSDGLETSTVIYGGEDIDVFIKSGID